MAATISYTPTRVPGVRDKAELAGGMIPHDAEWPGHTYGALIPVGQSLKDWLEVVTRKRQFWLDEEDDGA
jgi:hypothetical protein